MVQKILDNVQLLMSQFARSRLLSEHDLGYLESTLLVILGQGSDAQVSCLIIAPSGPLSDIKVRLDGLTANPGVVHFSGNLTSVQEKLLLLKGLGYTLKMYQYQYVKDWIEVLGSIKTSDSVVDDPYNLGEIAKALPKTHIYCDVFGGSAPLLCCLDPAPVEVVNDRGSFVVGFMQLLQHIESLNLLVLLSRVFPFSIQFDPDSLRRFIHTTPREDPDIVRGFGWYRMVRENYRLSWPRVGNTAKQVLVTSPKVSRGLEILDPLLPSLHGRLLRVQYENNQYHKIMDSFDSADTLFWVDVPLNAGNDDNTTEISNTLQQLDQRSGHVVVYWRPSCSNFVLSELIQEGIFSTDKWYETQLSGAIAYTKPATNRRK